MRAFIALALVPALGVTAAARPSTPQQGAAVGSPVQWTGQPVQGGLLLGSVDEAVEALTLQAAGAPDRPAALHRGRFMLGLDRDAPAEAMLVAQLRDGSLRRIALPVAPRAWRLERVNAPYRPPGFDARRPAELARIAAARDAADPEGTGWTRGIAWPLTGPVRGLFGAQRIYQGKPGSYHGGIDIAAPTGTPVRAPAAGRVVLATATPFTLEGNLLLIDHGGGLQSALMHLSRIDVAEGATVVPGQLVGAVGATGRATGPHLHWGLSWRGARLDPLLVAGPMRSATGGPLTAR